MKQTNQAITKDIERVDVTKEIKGYETTIEKVEKEGNKVKFIII